MSAMSLWSLRASCAFRAAHASAPRGSISGTAAAWRAAPAQYASHRHSSQMRVTLLPEIPPDTAATNPLLRSPQSGLPEWSAANDKNAYNGLGKALLLYESAVLQAGERSKDPNIDFDSLFAPLEEAKVQLESVWNTVNLLHMATEALNLDRYTAIYRRVERALLAIYDSDVLYKAMRAMREKHDAEGNLSPAQLRILDRHLLEFKRQGYELSEKKKYDLNVNWMKKLLGAQRDYNFRYQMVTERFRGAVRDPNVVRDFPLDVLKAMAHDNTQPSKGPWSVTMHPYIHRKFLEYCPVRQLRWNAHVGDVSRGSERIDVNTGLNKYGRDIRIHRTDQALALGYKHYADMSMETKMAGSVENVHTMIACLLGKAKEGQERELTALQEFADSRGFDEDLAVYDVAYFQRKQKRAFYGIVDEDLRDFFPLPRVMTSIFGLVQTLFDVVIEEETKDVEKAWHQDVKLFRVIDAKSTKQLGRFYFDPYMRDDKNYLGGDKGWYVPLRPHSGRAGTQALGTVLLSLPTPGYGKPSLLTFDEVREILRIMGNLLIHMISNNEWSDLAGKMGVEWDALDVPSLFLMEWLYTPEVLTSISGHWSSNEALSPEMIEGLCMSRQHMAGYHLCRELYKSAVDMALFSEDFSKEGLEDMSERLHKQYLLLPNVKEDAFPFNFHEVLGGERPAGYFSHTWARMLAADAFSAVQEVGIDQTEEVQKVTKRFRNTFLSLGSSQPAAEVFRQFRGRDPSHEALLLNLGLTSIPKPKMKASKED